MSEIVNIKIHPRAFAAFGEDLVTNDNVAILELVKNSYDAFAFNVDIEFGKNDIGECYIKITDDGLGMSKDVIINAWATFATPYKKKNPIVSRKVDGIEKTRIVSGNKGLGRFSAARLGKTMTMITKVKDGQALKAFFDWGLLNNIDSLDECNMTLDELDNENITEGTCIIIGDLNSDWNSKDKIDELTKELSRLVSPFQSIEGFSIRISTPVYEEEQTMIKPSTFIDNPIYKIIGNVDERGTIHYSYHHHNDLQIRDSEGSISWSTENYAKVNDLLKKDGDLLPYQCGSFTFEIRAWDMDSDNLGKVSNRFDIGRREIKKRIKQYKGISVYRDGILVLPKSESGRDWLGLDEKRISQVGRRISTNQVIGIVQISNENNPEIRDTTDREKIADTFEYKQFVEVMKEVVDCLQRERMQDRTEAKKPETLSELLSPLSAEKLVETIENAVEEGAAVNEIVTYVREYHEKNEQQLEELNNRLIYYGQTASLGSVAILLMHEILTGLTSIKRFLNRIKKVLPNDERTKQYFSNAEISHERILQVTNSFAPLYRRGIRNENNKVSLRKAVDNSICLITAKKMCKSVDFKNNIPSNVEISMNEGELQTVFVNLFDNAAYWLQNNSSAKTVHIDMIDMKDDKIIVAVSDNGCGVSKENMEKIFFPGVTSKPKGIGMGLTIVTEIIKGYGGTVGISAKGILGGATFVFELPVFKKK